MNDILKIVTSLEYSGILLKGVSETIKDEAKEQRGGFLSMLLGTLGASLLGNMLAGKGVVRAGKGTIRAGYGSEASSFKKFLIPSHPLTNLEIKSYGVYSRDNLPNKIKHGAYVINLDEYSDIGTDWIVLYVNNKTATYFDSFRVEHISKEIKKFVNNKNIIANDSVMCGYFCIGFIDFMFKDNDLTDFTNPFSPNDFKKK